MLNEIIIIHETLHELSIQLKVLDYSIQGGALNVPCLNVPKPGTFRDTKVQFRVLSFLVD